MRLAAWYAVSLVLCGSVLLALAYGVVSHSIRAHDARVSQDVQRGLAHQRARALASGLPGAPPEPRRAISREERELRRSAEERARAQQRTTIERSFLEALGGLALLSWLIGWLVAGRALQPLATMTATAKGISERRLGERIGLTGPCDELRELARTIDGMLDRLESAFESQKQFVGNASHELRTPLAIARAELDATLGDANASEADLRSMAGVVSAAIARLDALVSSLLALARSEATIESAAVADLAELVEASLDVQLRAIGDCGIRLEQSLEPALTSGDPALLEGLVHNLLQNAVRYNRSHGVLAIATATGPDEVQLVIENDGEQIRADEVAGLFEPFRRREASRTRHDGGVGLGLSIVRAAARAHGGDVAAHARDGGGLHVEVRLPRAADAMQAR
jgi:signal transduction histidine kinase